MNAIGHSFQDDGEPWICYADRFSSRPTDQRMAKEIQLLMSFGFLSWSTLRFHFWMIVCRDFLTLRATRIISFVFECACLFLITRIEASVDNNYKPVEKEEIIIIIIWIWR